MLKKIFSLWIIFVLISSGLTVGAEEQMVIDIAPLSYSSASSYVRESGSALIILNKTHATYTVSVPKDGTYLLGVKANTSNQGAMMNVSVNDCSWGDFSLGNETGKSQTKEVDLTEMSLYKGTVDITLKVLAGNGAYIFAITLKEVSKDFSEIYYISEKTGETSDDKDINIGAGTGTYCTINTQNISTGVYRLYVSATATSDVLLNIYQNGLGNLSLANVKVPAGDWMVFQKIYAGKIEIAENTNDLTVYLKGTARFSGFILDKIAPPDETTFLEKVNNAKGAKDIEKILNEDELPFVEDFDDIFYPCEVYAKVAGGGFTSFDDFSKKIKEAYKSAKESPIVRLLVNDELKSSLSAGNVKIEVLSDLKNKTTIACGIYENSRLKSFDFKTAENRFKTVLNLGNVENSNATVKIFMFEDFDKLKVTDFYNVLDETVANEIYVSPNGSDEDGKGSVKSPFKTIQKAKECVNAISEEVTEGINVNIFSGEYFIDEPILFTGADNGKSGQTITYKGVGDKKPLISGGVKVTGKWQEYKDGIYKVEVPGVDEARQMYINGYAAQKAVSKGYYIAKASYKKEGSPYDEDGFIIGGDGVPDFKKPDKLELSTHILWAHQRVPVESVFRENGDTCITLKQPYYNAYIKTICAGGIQPTVGSRVYFENALELLDEEGEFYFDDETHMLYYYPFGEENLDEADVFLPKAEGVIKIEGNSLSDKVKNISFENLDIRHSAYNEATEKGFCSFQADCLVEPYGENTNASLTGLSVKSQISVKNAENIKIKGCSISNSGSAAIGMYEGVTDSTIYENSINDISASGVIVGSWRERTTADIDKLCKNITVKNNIINRAGTEFMGSVGVGIYYAKDIKVINNHLKDLPYSGMTIGWGWSSSAQIMPYCGGHSISKNIIEDVSKEEQDGGHIYTLGNLNGTVISENYFTKSDDLGGMYFDSGSSNVTFENNVVEKCENSWLFRNNPTSGYGITVRGNHVDVDRKSQNFDYENQGNYVEAPTVYENGVFTGVAKTIIESAGVEDEISESVVTSDYPDWRKTAYDYVPHTESTIDGEYVIEGEDFKDYFLANGNIQELYIYKKGNGRTVIGNFQMNNWFSYDADVKEAGTYLLELRYSTGPTANTKNEMVTFEIDGETQINKLVLEDTLTSWNTHPGRIIGTVNLKEGINEIKLINKYYAWSFDNFKLYKISE